MTTDADIRKALASVIRKAAPYSVVFPWWVLGGDPKNWPAKMVSESDPDSSGKPRVHGYIVTRRQDGGHFKYANCTRRRYGYQIRGYYFYETGTENDNSDLRFNAELDAITGPLDNLALIEAELPDAFQALQRRVEPGSTEPHPIEWRIDLAPYGAELLHVAIGEITIEPC